MRSFPGVLLPSRQEAKYGFSGIIPTNKQTNKPLGNTENSRKGRVFPSFFPGDGPSIFSKAKQCVVKRLAPGLSYLGLFRYRDLQKHEVEYRSIGTSRNTRWSIVFRVLYQQTNKPTNQLSSEGSETKHPSAQA